MMGSHLYQANQPYQQRASPVYLSVTPTQRTRFVMAQPAQDFYSATNMHHNWGNPTNPAPMPFPPTYGPRCVFVMTEPSVGHADLVFPEQQHQQHNYTFYGPSNVSSPPMWPQSPEPLQQHNCTFYGPSSVSSPPMWPQSPEPLQLAAPALDSRLNPNSREFVWRPPANIELQGAGAAARSAPEGASSSQSTLRNPSSESIASRLDDKLRNVNSRFDSGDSGVASASSAHCSSDDDSGTAKSSTLEEDKKRLWDEDDEKKYWKSVIWSPPSISLCQEIVDQLESYLSDEYLSKDKYLLRQVRGKGDGYISIKLLTSFKKMKKLAQVYPVLRCAIFRACSTMFVTGEGLRVKRLAPLPEELQKPQPIFKVLIIRLPEVYNAIDQLSSLFTVFGMLGSIALIRPENIVPSDLRNYATQVPDIGLSICAVIEFDSSDDALTSVRVVQHRNRKFATDVLNSETEDDDGTCRRKGPILSPEEQAQLKKVLEKMPDLGDARLALLGPRIRRTLYRQDRFNKSADCDNTVQERRPLTSGLNASYNTSQLSRDLRHKVPSTNSSAIFWRSTTPPSQRRDPTMATNVLRQPRGPRGTQGFQLRRTFAEK